MRILDKYTIKFFLIPFFYCIFLFMFLYMIIDLFGHLDEILKHSVPILILQEYYLSMIPFIVINTAPIAALISTIYVISTMNRNDEITAMRAAGISIARIVMPFVFTGLLISIGVFLVSEKILPIGMKNAQYIKENYIEKGKDSADKKIINNIALYSKDNKLIFIETYDRNNNTAALITILQQDKDGNVIKKINARKARWIDSRWVFSDILIYRLDEDGSLIGNPLFFKEKVLSMENPKDLISRGTNYEFMNFRGLSSYIDNLSNAPPNIIQRLRVDLHQKISFPFTTTILILIGSALAIKIKPRGRAGAIMGVGISIVVGSIYYALMATFIAFGKSGVLPPIAASHLANALFGSIGIILLKN